MSGHFRLLAVIVLALATPAVVGYIHFPPMTLQKLCKTSTNIRLLRVKKYDKQKGVVVFDDVRDLKGENTRIASFKHAIRTDVDGVKPILDWLGDQKRAVMFSIEGGGIACGYVFLDEYCYSVDYNRDGQYWLLIRAEPTMSACYHGSAEQLETMAKEILDGKDVKVPVKEPVLPQSKEDREKRAKEVTDILTKNRKK